MLSLAASMIKEDAILRKFQVDVILVLILAVRELGMFNIVSLDLKMGFDTV
jgi:hypothetical protein